MVKVFIDTNILIDFFLPERKDYEIAAEVFTMILDGSFEAAISTQSILDTIYVCQKSKNADMVSMRSKMSSLTLRTNIGQIDSFEIRDALENQNPDIEDNAQISFAYDQVCDIFLTNDRKILSRKLPEPMIAMTPSDFVDRCKQ